MLVFSLVLACGWTTVFSGFYCTWPSEVAKTIAQNLSKELSRLLFYILMGQVATLGLQVGGNLDS